MLTITLPGDIADLFIKQAQKQGTTPELLALEALRTAFTPDSSSPDENTGSLYDFLAEVLEPVDGSGEPLAEQSEHYFAEIMTERQKVRYL